MRGKPLECDRAYLIQLNLSQFNSISSNSIQRKEGRPLKTEPFFPLIKNVFKNFNNLCLLFDYKEFASRKHETLIEFLSFQILLLKSFC